MVLFDQHLCNITHL